MGRYIRHTACNQCGSSDANAVYEDGSAYCWSCKWYTKANGEGYVDKEFETRNHDFIDGECLAIAPRALTQATCELWGYEIGTYQGEPCQIANYLDHKGRLIAQKIRRKDKKFTIIGNGKELPLYGEWLWNDGKAVIVTEGELDALSASQAFDNKYAVVSLPAGAQSAVKAIQRSYEWLDRFEKIVLCLDNDEPGRQATEEIAALLPPGKAFVMTLPTKDASDALVHHGPGVITKSFWNARQWRPDGIVQAKDLKEEVINPVSVETIPYPFNGLNEKLGGLRIGELVTVTAGSGVGKSTMVRELIYDIAVKRGAPVGVMALEESNRRTMEGLISIHLNRNIVLNRELVSKEQLSAAFDAVATPNLYLFDHFGSTEVENILNRVRYMARALNVKWVFIDHLSILVSGLESSASGDERKLIDLAMTKLRTLVSELNIGMVLVSHLRRPEGNKGHEDGAEVHLGQLRGSHSIAQLSDAVIGIQRDVEEPNASRIELVVLKNRWSGNRGSACILDYDRDTGRLTESIF